MATIKTLHLNWVSLATVSRVHNYDNSLSISSFIRKKIL